jgi:ribosomal protein L11 methyltransferase
MAESSWLEVSLVVNGELAEAVAEVLARFAPNGVVIESTAVTANADDTEGHAVGPLRVAAYLPVNEALEETCRKLEEALWYLGRIQPLADAQFKLVQEADWAEAWKAHYRPIAIGQRLIIVPAWLENPDPDRIPIRMDPGMAFGTGTHPSTQLCLELIEGEFGSNNQAGRTKDEGRRTKDEWASSSSVLRPSSVIDIGSGSGILSVAALKLGAEQALGVDIDPMAVKVSVENAALNGVAGQFEAGIGSVAEVRAGKFSRQSAPLVIANILAPVIVQLLDEGLGELMEPGAGQAALILSGIIESQAGEVETALGKHGLGVIKRRQAGDWMALLAGAKES